MIYLNEYLIALEELKDLIEDNMAYKEYIEREIRMLKVLQQNKVGKIFISQI